MPDGAQFTSGYVTQNDLPFPVLSDIDLGYSLSLGLIFWVGAAIRKLYEEVGVKLEKYHGNQGYFLPIVAKFIVGRDGLVKARQLNTEFRERMAAEEKISGRGALSETINPPRIGLGIAIRYQNHRRTIFERFE